MVQEIPSRTLDYRVQANAPDWEVGRGPEFEFVVVCRVLSKERAEQIARLLNKDESGKTLSIIYTWPDGRKEVRYQRLVGSDEAQRLVDEVDAIRKRLGDKCPYSYEVE